MAYYFTCKTEKSPLAYHIGEEIVFRIFYRLDGATVPAPRFRWKLLTDFGGRAEGEADGAAGELLVSARLERPGFVFVQAEATEADGTPCADSDRFFGGAGVDIPQIEHTTEKPADYEAFWQACRAECEAVAPQALLMRELAPDAEFPHHRLYDVRIACAGGTPVSGYLSIPQDGKKHPARAIYQGYGVKSAWRDFSDEEIQLCINAHGIRNGEPDGYYDALANGVLSRYGMDPIRNERPETCYFKNMMLRAAQALRFLMTLPEWDGAHLLTRGGSQGAVQAVHASALVPQVTQNDIFVPWLCDIESFRIGRLNNWKERYAPALSYFDLTLQAENLHAKTTVMAGLGDYTSPPSGVVLLYRALRTEKEMTFVQSREHIYISPEAEEFRM